jgi:SAM-dependent methyltransferase
VDRGAGPSRSPGVAGLSEPAKPPSLPHAFQESYYDEDVDYRVGSPHLTHWPLYERLVGIVRTSIADLQAAGLGSDVLEIGAGHGGYTEPVLAAGCRVTAVEASRPSLAVLERRYGANPDFSAVFDPDGSLDAVDGTFSLILIVSVLHHIPDYATFLDRVTGLLAPGGSLLSLQDPLWYSRLARRTHLLDRGGYYVWRIGQGNARQALATLSRRVRGVHDPSNPADMVEYHVVRDGVDEQAVMTVLGDRFDAVELLPYWSNQFGAVQRLGERLGLANTFGVLATGHRPDDVTPAMS